MVINMQFDAVVEIDGRLHVSTPGGEKKALCSLLGSTLCFFFFDWVGPDPERTRARRIGQRW